MARRGDPMLMISSMATLALFLLAQCMTIAYAANRPEVDVSLFGAKGDGATDDTKSLQKALTDCSTKGFICKIPSGKNFLVTSPIYIWGDGSLTAENGQGSITFNVASSPYLLNVGISGRDRLEKPFAGVISGVKFKVIGGKGGRIIFFWRTDGAGIFNNIFDVGVYAYSATSSGNDNAWVKNGFANTIRKNVTITGNTIIATSDSTGSEGIGLGHFDGALISGNTVTGVGDDPIGIHFCKNVKILGNALESVDGRLFVVNSRHVQIHHNIHRRIASPKDGKFYKGISLLYIGFELHDAANSLAAPTDIHVYNNYLHYPPGSIDTGAAIYLYGPRDVVVENNRVVNDSADVIASGIHLLPAMFSSEWADPDGRDPVKVARVWGVTLSGNSIEGKFPRKLIMTGNCADYRGKVVIKDNKAKGYQLYCPQITHVNNRNSP